MTNTCSVVDVQLMFLLLSIFTGVVKSEKEAHMAFKETDSKDHIINALKNRVCDLEELNKEAKQKNRCLICLVRFWIKNCVEIVDHFLFFLGRLSAASCIHFVLACALRGVLASSIGISCFVICLKFNSYSVVLFWFQGNKKLCPQCNLITSPTHLRRIYMWCDCVKLWFSKVTEELSIFQLTFTLFFLQHVLSPFDKQQFLFFSKLFLGCALRARVYVVHV